ncbi:hypothetical protein GGS23DRAFT_566445 [Durotheca rogersii]|uniref:uncharacterized protein n=1 Tax=Durotheca rogersii TaxID=419775 RepID=UPI0022212290|nr:uncharacterized protein GGS23DRAFT_566445 [Durotheca rogersii]KAI5863328.1 hypothetical protein GGS23DRAFT_566445 [Durotheca rogersii]
MPQILQFFSSNPAFVSSASLTNMSQTYSPLEVSKRTLHEAWRRRDQAKLDLEDANAEYRSLYRRCQQGRGSSVQLDGVARRVRNLEYAVENKLPAAIASAYERYLWDFYTEHGLGPLPYDISENTSQYLGDRARQIRNQVEAQYLRELQGQR